MAPLRPCEHGIVTNWPCQVEVWQRLLPQALKTPPGASAAHKSTLMVTSAPFTPESLTSHLDQVVFEELRFGALQRMPTPAAAACLYQHEAAAAAAEALAGIAAAPGGGGVGAGGSLCCLVVDFYLQILPRPRRGHRPPPPPPARGFWLG